LNIRLRPPVTGPKDQARQPGLNVELRRRAARRMVAFAIR
jgi:hypothetical protein